MRSIVRQSRKAGVPRLVNSDSIANRALVVVIAIMTFLGTLTGGAASLVRDASVEWSSSVTREMTIQVKPVLGRNLDGDVSLAQKVAIASPGVLEAYALSKEDSSAMLKPWLGSGLDLRDLPVPILIKVRFEQTKRPEVLSLAASLKNQLPHAVLDDHRTWADRLYVVANGLVAIAFIVLCLVLAAMGLAVAFATRGAMAGSREIIEVLHLVGASDGFIAKEFQRHFLGLGVTGALTGGSMAAASFYILGWASQSWMSTPNGDQVEALFGRFDLGYTGYGAVVSIACMMALLTGIISRLVVQKQLRTTP
jgi:cell division transport system permease protein